MERICKAEGCDRTDIKGKGYCSMHWQRMRKHGSLTPKILKNGPRSQYPEEYKAWEGARQRCYVKTNRAYKNYGGRGIKMCDRWLEKPYGFSNFMEDMGPKPSYERTPRGGNPVWSLDRIDYDGDYCPENCRWADWVTQAGNRGTVHGTAGVKQIDGLWVVRHRTAKAVIRGSFATEEMAIEAKKDWEKKYPS